jgi:hypothetical protein
LVSALIWTTSSSILVAISRDITPLAVQGFPDLKVCYYHRLMY